jgi:hypothetical protein
VPTTGKPERTQHISEVLRDAVTKGTLSGASRVVWNDPSTLHELVDIGLACCVDDAEARLSLVAVQARVQALMSAASMSRTTVRILVAGSPCRSVAKCMRIQHCLPGSLFSTTGATSSVVG